MKDHFYHSLLRISSLLVALLLVFESGVLFPVTKELSSYTHLYLANTIGIQASVESTELNILTAGLTARENELSAREAALSEREIAVARNEDAAPSNTATYVLSVLLFILLVLMILNYILDFSRAADQKNGATRIQTS